MAAAAGGAALAGSLARELEAVGEDVQVGSGPVGGASEGRPRGGWELGKGEVGSGGEGGGDGGEARGWREITPPSQASGKAQIPKSSLCSGFCMVRMYTRALTFENF